MRKYFPIGGFDIMKKAGLYVRVSTEEQKKHGLSVDSQIKALQDYCKQNKYQVEEIYNDAGISARKRYTKRPELLRLIEDCKKGNIDIIIFTKLDRWFRSVADYYEVQTILDKYHVPWRAIWEDYETETSAGVFKVNIMLSVAQSEADRTSERIQAIFDYKIAKGEHLGKVPFGYKRIDKKLVIDEDTKAIVQEMFSTYLITNSTQRTTERLREFGYNYSPDSVRRMLKNEVYCGTIQGNKCPKYITVAQHDYIVNNMSKNIRIGKNKEEYIFSGLIKCGYCGNTLHAKTGKHISEYTGKLLINHHYMCDRFNHSFKHDQKLTISELKMEKYLLNNLSLLIDDYNLNIDVLPKQKDVNKKIQNLKAKIERVGIRFEEGDLSLNEYKEKKYTLQIELKELQNQITAPSKPIVIPNNWQDIYNDLDTPHKRAFWKSIIKEIVITNETKTNPKIVIECHEIIL